MRGSKHIEGPEDKLTVVCQTQRLNTSDNNNLLWNHSNKQKHCQMLLQYYFLAINPASGGVKTQEQSKHNFWSKMMKVTVPAKEEKNTPYPWSCIFLAHPHWQNSTQPNCQPLYFHHYQFHCQMFHHKFMYHNWQLIATML